MKLPAANPKSVKAIREFIQDGLFFIGIAGVVYGVHSIYPPAACIVAGLVAVYVSWMMR